jgi:hypothetical protein
MADQNMSVIKRETGYSCITANPLTIDQGDLTNPAGKSDRTCLLEAAATTFHTPEFKGFCSNALTSE